MDRRKHACGCVPLDYRKPRGRQITIAITQVKAVDRKHRLGSLALNPGGPGGAGYLFPLQIASMSEANAKLNDRYDLIGFDPRGVGYSTKVNCPAMGGQAPEPGPLTKAATKRIYDSGVANNKACGSSDPTFLAQLTTLNSARDLDRVRIALGERKLSFMGISWGTWLGVVYRSTFPGSVGRMFLDSVAPVHFRLDDFEDGHAEGTERNFERMAAWIAKRNATYGLGTTPKEVRTNVLAVRMTRTRSTTAIGRWSPTVPWSPCWPAGAHRTGRRSPRRSRKCRMGRYSAAHPQEAHDSGTANAPAG